MTNQQVQFQANKLEWFKKSANLIIFCRNRRQKWKTFGCCVLQQTCRFWGRTWRAGPLDAGAWGAVENRLPSRAHKRRDLYAGQMRGHSCQGSDNRHGGCAASQCDPRFRVELALLRTRDQSGAVLIREINNSNNLLISRNNRFIYYF